MTKSELIEELTKTQSDLTIKEMEQVVNCMLEKMSQTLATGGKIEVRGFASFSLHHRPPRMSRNPQTGEAIALTSKYVPFFKPGKELRERINESRKKYPISK